jgi:prepilin-type N-terminal cleavage/methylation domain-containing protein
MVFAKLVKRGAKSGYTLVEVLVVVVIMGILSAMGVAGLQGAVANARVKDAAENTAAFVERAANLSTQLNEVLCLKVPTGNPQKIYVVRDVVEKNCVSPNGGIVDSLEIDSPNQFVSKNNGCPVIGDWFSSYGVFKPRLGLSAMPREGGICIQYGNQSVYGAVRKDPSKNHVVPMWKVTDDATQNNGWSNWTEL